ncbi:MAG: hypothetical protein ABH872_01440 [Candidatus Omnitrophota bacterium]
MTVASRLGIGTTSPAATLDIVRDTGINSVHGQFPLGIGSSPGKADFAMFINSNGRIGIGVNDAERTLHVGGVNGIRLKAADLNSFPRVNNQPEGDTGDIVVDLSNGNALSWHDGEKWRSAGRTNVHFDYYCSYNCTGQNETCRLCPPDNPPIENHCPVINNIQFKEKVYLGEWGNCEVPKGPWGWPPAYSYYHPPGGGCFPGDTKSLPIGKAYICGEF